MQRFEDELNILLTKVGLLFPAFLAIMMKLAIDVKRSRFKVINAMVSIFTGVGGAYIVSPYLLANCGKNTYPIYIALVAIASEKTIEWLMLKLGDVKLFDKAFTIFTNYFKSFLKK
jgi:hypothetical protein